MTDTQPNQAMPASDSHKGGNPGIDAPHGKTGGGESAGGGYPNPQTGKTGENSGFMGHGGQSGMDYSGTGAKDDKGGENDNAATGAKTGG